MMKQKLVHLKDGLKELIESYPNLIESYQH